LFSTFLAILGDLEKKKRLGSLRQQAVFNDQILLLPRKDQNDTFWTMPIISFIAIRAKPSVHALTQGGKCHECFCREAGLRWQVAAGGFPASNGTPLRIIAKVRCFIGPTR
jgi:hypothetical protein